MYLEKIPRVIEVLEDYNVPYIVSLGSGVLNPFFKNKSENLISEIYKLVKRSKGKVNGQFGVGVVKKDFVDDIDKRVLKSIKRRYDPEGKFNCGVLIDNNEIYSNNNGIYLKDYSGGLIRDCTISNNYIHDNVNHGIQWDRYGTVDSVIDNHI